MPSIRHLAKNNRDVTFVLHQHSNLTVEQLRQHLETDPKLGQLRLTEESRLHWVQVFADTNLPPDPRFWSVLQTADEMERCYPTNPDCRADRWAQAFFQTDFAQRYGEPVSPGWYRAADRIFHALTEIREAARMKLRQISNRLRKSWKQGEIQGLVEAVQGGLVQESWVSQAIWEQQYRVIVEDSLEKEKDEARALLQQIGKALCQTGQGRNKEIDAEKKKIIIADCKRWRPICKKLNTAFKKLWDDSKYLTSEQCRKKIEGCLQRNLISQ